MATILKKAGSAARTRSARIRAGLKHPVIDADGHVIEYGPAYFEYLKKAGGPALAERNTSPSSKPAGGIGCRRPSGCASG